MSSSLVSTIIPVYNRPTQLRQAVESVLLQDYRPVEVIIVDDGSSDDTPAVAGELAGAHPQVVRVLTQANAGPGAARERGRREAQGEFLQYLDSDDVLLPGKFAVQVAALRQRPDCHVAYGMTRFRRRDGTTPTGPWKGSGVARTTMFPTFLTERWWDTPTPLYRREICDRAGPWSTLRLEEDWEYDCRVASMGALLVWCNQYVCEVRDHPGDRLCRDGTAPERLRHRARSHTLILGHAQRAGIGPDAPEMQHFARGLFLLARQCGAAGLPDESRQLFDLARAACGRYRARGLDFTAYRTLAAVFGWRAAGRASQWLDSVRNARTA
jgi:glycosyltransferase involved in cell wall biosynthesis